MKWRALRISVLSVAAVGLVAASIGVPVYGGDLSPAVVGDRIHRAPNNDTRIPYFPITSPGFPSALSGKCLTWQDCQEYCNTHQSDHGCARFVNDSSVYSSPKKKDIPETQY